MSDAQAAAGKADEFLASSPTLEEMRAFFESVPKIVRELAGVEGFYEELQAMDSPPKNEVSKGPVNKLKAIGAECEKWHSSQQSRGGGSGQAQGKTSS